MKPQRLPKSLLIKTKPWEDVLKFFAEISESNSYFLPIHRFVSEIATSKYVIGLYYTTSMHDLWISQSEEFEMGHEVLIVRFDGFKHRFLFEYVEHPHTKNSWRRECSEADAFQTFERFLEKKKWFLKVPEEKQMNELPKSYDPAAVEPSWAERLHWRTG